MNASRLLLTFLGIKVERRGKKDFKTNGGGLNVLRELHARTGKWEKT